jgi:hypothetical protein
LSCVRILRMTAWYKIGGLGVESRVYVQPKQKCLNSLSIQLLWGDALCTGSLQSSIAIKTNPLLHASVPGAMLKAAHLGQRRRRRNRWWMACSQRWSYTLQSKRGKAERLMQFIPAVG